MDAHASPGRGLEAPLEGQDKVLENCPGLPRCWVHGGTGLPLLSPGAQQTTSLFLVFVLFALSPDALQKPTRELGEALLICARTRASPQAVARTQRTGKSRGRMGRTPLTWERGNHTDEGGKETGRAGRAFPTLGPFPEWKGTAVWRQEGRKGSRRS